MAVTFAGLALGDRASKLPPDQAGLERLDFPNQSVATQTNSAKTTRQRFTETDIVSNHTVIVVFTRKDVAKYHKAILDHYGDLVAFLRGMDGLDSEITSDLIHIASQNSAEMDHLENLLSIDSLVKNEADRQRIKPVITEAVGFFAKRIGLSIEEVNNGLARLKSQVVIATAIKLRDDLRDLKALLLTGK